MLCWNHSWLPGHLLARDYPFLEQHCKNELELVLSKANAEHLRSKRTCDLARTFFCDCLLTIMRLSSQLRLRNPQYASRHPSAWQTRLCASPSTSPSSPARHSCRSHCPSEATAQACPSSSWHPTHRPRHPATPQACNCQYHLLKNRNRKN